MKILLINPNTTKEMTEGALKTALKVKDPRTEIVGVTNEKGPRSIEGVLDGIMTTEGVLEIIINEEDNYDAFIIACFSSHPSVIAGREVTKKPVIGIFEAAAFQACMLGEKFGIVTTSKRWVPLLDAGVHQLGVASRCAGIRSTGLSVLDLESKDPKEVEDILLETSRKTVDEDGTEVILLGCAGMAGLNEKLETELGVTVIDAVGAATKMAEALIYQKLYTSKVGAYAPVEKRETINISPIFDKVYK